MTRIDDNTAYTQCKLFCQSACWNLGILFTHLYHRLCRLCNGSPYVYNNSEWVLKGKYLIRLKRLDIDNHPNPVGYILAGSGINEEIVIDWDNLCNVFSQPAVV